MRLELVAVICLALGCGSGTATLEEAGPVDEVGGEANDTGDIGGGGDDSNLSSALPYSNPFGPLLLSSKIVFILL